MSTKQTAELQKQLDEMKALMQQQEQTAAAAARTAAAAATTAAATAAASATAAAELAATATATATAAATKAEKDALLLRIDDLERNQTSTGGLPSPVNLSSTMTPVVLDETTVKIWITDSETRNRNLLDSKLADLETKFNGRMTRNHHLNVGAQIPTGGATSAPRVGPFSPQTGIPPQTPPTSPSLTTITASSTIQAPIAQTNISVTGTNDYDKAIEVDQRSLRNPELTPSSIREWKLSYDKYEQHPNHRMTTVDAFGDISMSTLEMMFPKDTIPMDNTGFLQYLFEKFLKAENLFADITSATAIIDMKKNIPLTLVALQTYLASFCKVLTYYAGEITLRNSDPDLHKTLVNAFYGGISSKAFTQKLEETSCSTWQAAQDNFRKCMTATNVQLANA